MLGRAWLIFTFGMILAAVILREVPLLLVALLFSLTSAIARLWARYALDRLEYQRFLSATRVFFGETVTLDIGIANLKILPLPWVHIQEQVPEELTFLKGRLSPSYGAARATLSSVLSLGWYKRVTRRYPVQCLRRGYFTFGPATIRSGDLFGFFHKEARVQKLDNLLVYPRIVPLEDLGIASRYPFGDLRVRRHLFEDPVRVAATREYSYSDPLKRIHWKATARLGRLQSRVFEPTTTVDLALFLDLRTGGVEHLLETAVITAASIASHAVVNGYRVGLYANELYRRTDQIMKLPPSNHPDQLPRVLEALAQVQGLPFVKLEQLLHGEGRSLPWDTTLVVITAMPNELLLAALVRYKRAGRRVALIQVGEQATRPSLGGLPVYHVSDQVYWQELESVQLGQAQE
ncbi:MAG: DUF58 domain-containing protein [Dehalococcoidia bacterium]